MRILVTAGPTREHLDSVRFISNASSGKMGYAVARAASRRGHKVILVSGPVALRPPSGVQTVSVVSAAQMARAARRAFAACDAAIFTAAVCDYRPSVRARYKVPKGHGPRTVVLAPTEDIAAALGRIKRHRVTVGFAMEDHDGRRHAEVKLARKNCDAIVLNGLGNVGSDSARVAVLVAGGRWQEWPGASKAAVATRIVRMLEGMKRRRGGGRLAQSAQSAQTVRRAGGRRRASMARR